MPQQRLRGSYTQEYHWKVPKGIDLNDEETYEYFNRWDVLFIKNKKTGVEIQIESFISGGDGKRAEQFDVEDGYDSDSDDAQEKAEQ